MMEETQYLPSLESVKTVKKKNANGSLINMRKRFTGIRKNLYKKFRNVYMHSTRRGNII